MTDREKLIELLTGKSIDTDVDIEYVVDHLIENGVTFNRIGEWKTHIADDGYVHHFCSECGTDAIFEVLYVPDYDEDLDGEWRYCGDRECGIAESLTQCCPHCGVKMRGDKE
jgi:hypothetical protein